MELTRKEFILLTALAEAKDTMSQRELAASGGMSIGSVNRLLRDLSERGYVKAGRLTPDGLLALEPYRVKRAVFMAAGFGARMVPITLNTPKPLIRVRGQRIIDTLLDAVLAAGIEEIYIVRGYLAEEFDQLLYKYPMGTLAMLYGIDIPYYIRINFAGFKDIVNALGGVTVRSDYTFAAQGYQFTEGDNAVMGDAALAFVRERHSFAAGANQRGRDQMAMIEAILKKAMGKLAKFYSENCLLQQEFVKDGDFTVEKYMADSAKKLGGSVKFVKAVRFEKGEGIEKKKEDFAAEIASMP